MDFGFQVASGAKRISAFLFDAIMVSIIAVGIGYLFSLAVGYNGRSQQLDEDVARYEKEYGVSFRISREEYDAMPEEGRKAYDDAYQALTADQEAMRNYQLLINLSLLMVNFSLLAAFLIWEFAVPLKLRHGRTLGKKIFGLAVMDTEGVKIRPLTLFGRTVLGKFAVETMVPAYVITMLLANIVGLIGVALVVILIIVELVLYFATPHHSLLHDKLASTVVVDYASQRIFDTREEMLAAKKKAAAEKAKQEEW